MIKAPLDRDILDQLEKGAREDTRDALILLTACLVGIGSLALTAL
jgi:hypothetical protein